VLAASERGGRRSHSGRDRADPPLAAWGRRSHLL